MPIFGKARAIDWKVGVWLSGGEADGKELIKNKGKT
jgi:hypothetical protein